MPGQVAVLDAAPMCIIGAMRTGLFCILAATVSVLMAAGCGGSAEDTATRTPTLDLTPKATAEPAARVPPTDAPIATQTPGAAPTPSPTATVTPTPTPAPGPTPTSVPIAESTATPTPPTPSPTHAPMVMEEPSPSPTPGAAATGEPSPTPTPEASAEEAVVQEFAIIENYVATRFYPREIVVIKDRSGSGNLNRGISGIAA